jgi:hypothetical protein
MHMSSLLKSEDSRALPRKWHNGYSSPVKMESPTSAGKAEMGLNGAPRPETKAEMTFSNITYVVLRSKVPLKGITITRGLHRLSHSWGCTVALIIVSLSGGGLCHDA